MLLREKPWFHTTTPPPKPYRTVVWSLVVEALRANVSLNALTNAYQHTFHLDRTHVNMRFDWKRVKAWALANGKAIGSNNALWRCGEVMSTNAYAFPSGFGFYAQLSYFNHSCKSNARIVSTDSDGTITMILMEDVARAAEITVSYGDGSITDTESVVKRRVQLQKKHQFHCLCTRCCREEAVKNKVTL